MGFYEVFIHSWCIHSLEKQQNIENYQTPFTKTLILLCGTRQSLVNCCHYLTLGFCYYVTLVNLKLCFKTQKSRNDTNELSNQGRGRLPTPAFCEAKWLLRESGTFGKQNKRFIFLLINVNVKQRKHYKYNRTFQLTLILCGPFLGVQINFSHSSTLLNF